MSGIGSAPFGSSLLGSGSVEQTQSVTSEIFPGGNANAFTTAKDYLVDGYGRITGWTGTKQKVYLALFTQRGSSSLPSFGLAPFPLVIRDDTIAQVTASIRTALQPMVTAREISIDHIEVITGGDRVRITLLFTDLKTRKKDSLALK